MPIHATNAYSAVASFSATNTPKSAIAATMHATTTQGRFYQSSFRHSREGGNPAKSRHWIPVALHAFDSASRGSEARNDRFIEVPTS